MTIIVPFGGMLADHIRKSGLMSTTNVRKVFNCGGFGLEGLFFLIVASSTTAVSDFIFYKYMRLRKKQTKSIFYSLVH